MTKARPSKILRIGVVQSGRIVEERIFRKKTRVTIGQSPKNTFGIPIAHLPSSYTLIELKGGQYYLRFVRGMDGRVSVRGEVIHLKALAEKNIAQRQGKHYLLPIDEGSRGKVVIGDVTLLFQFVDPPPPISKLQLPAVVKESWWKRIDGVFAAILLLSLLLQGGGVGGLQWWWLTVGQFEKKSIRPRAHFIATLKTEVQARDKEEERKVEREELLETAEVAAEPAEEEFAPDAEEPEFVEKKTDPATAHKGPKEVDHDPKKRYERQLNHVRRNTMLKFLVSAGGDATSGYRNTLERGVTRAKLSDAWRTTGGVAVAEPGDSRLYQGVPKAAEGDGGSEYRKLAKSGKHTGRIKTGKVVRTKKGPEVKVKARIGGKLGKRSGTGKIDAGSVASIFRRRRSAVRRCYEQSLRANPDVHGKVTIQFTIGPAGRITAIKVVQDTTGDSSIASCIVRRVRGWHFDPPEHGSVTFSYPFILSHG